ncbi:MAG: hypothetical protein HYW48_10600 [Deltaproteobacteria bacterium]|nr:hypothetical protein [Deltaproteobacteria bacterium]
MVQLSLNRWPPVLSHFLCLLLGIAFANIVLKPDKSSCFTADRVSISLPPQFFAMSSSAFKDGQKVFLGKREGKELCLFDNCTALLVQSQPFVVLSFRTKQVKELPEVFDSKNKGNIVLFPNLSQGVPKECSSRGQIVYGYGD